MKCKAENKMKFGLQLEEGSEDLKVGSEWNADDNRDNRNE